MAWLPVLLIENAQQSRQTGAAVESFRNEMVEGNKVNQAIAAIKSGAAKNLIEMRICCFKNTIQTRRKQRSNILLQ